MSVEFSAVVPAPVGEVFAFHERPGALFRLAPPWQPVRVQREAGSLADGQAVLCVPPGLRWVATHRPGEFDPPRRFADELTSLPLPWRHTHGFEPVGEGATRVTDHIETPIPERALRAMFAYRHRQLAADLAAHRWAGERGTKRLTVAITGSSGLVGSALAAFLSTGGHRVIRLVRRPARGPGERTWWPGEPGENAFADVDAVVHLAGAPIAGRFTPGHRKAVFDSRVGPTGKLARCLAGMSAPPGALITASAVGYYGPDRGDELLTEDSAPGGGFLADLVCQWEQATHPAAAAGIRCVQVRTGIVQSPRGGLLGLLYPAFLAGAGGRLGTGRQWMPWIGIDDLVDVYHHALADAGMSGPVNAVALQPVRNADYTRILAGTLHRPAVLPVPELAPRAILGQQATTEFALASQRAHPHTLLEHGHRFRHPDLAAALAHLLGHETPPGGWSAR